MDLEKILAKSNGENIITHTDKVVQNVKLLANKYALDSKQMQVLNLGAILHDIGKLTNRTQKYLHNNTPIIDNDKIKYLHNVIGWYFVTKYINHQDKQGIARFVLWHHANNCSGNELINDISNIANELSSEEIDRMKSFCTHYGILCNDQPDVNDDLNNEFYQTDNLLRSILITADVCASADIPVDNLFEKNVMPLSLIKEWILNSDRTKKQIEIINLITENTTTLIKAPTGFGKSIIGILWAMGRTKQVVWVCPTNVISESIYDDIIKNFDLLGINLNVELYITGERKKYNNGLGDFKSDIIVTNIDNYIKPYVTNSYGERCLMIYDCDVIFDEPHEYENMECALFEAYDQIMSKRHNVLNSTTLMLTATQPTFKFKRVGGKEINILPNTNTHYSAAHQDPIQIFFHDDMPEHLMDGEFVCFSHVVDDVQKYYSNYRGPKLISHGKYTDNDKICKKNAVLLNYGKGGNRDIYGVFTNQMLTTSCDYSVKKMFIKAPTMKNFSQGSGRVNRWGGMGLCEIHVSLNKSKRDRTFIGNRDANDLQELFVSELRQVFEFKTIILDDLYVFYNEFFGKHNELINKIAMCNLGESKKMIKYIYPKRKRNTNTIMKIANSNKLRKSASTDEIYINIDRTDTKERVTISYNISNGQDRSDVFDENEQHTYKKQLKIFKTYENNKHKKITPELMQRSANNYETPYPVFNYTYDPELGIIKKQKTI